MRSGESFFMSQVFSNLFSLFPCVSNLAPTATKLSCQKFTVSDIRQDTPVIAFLDPRNFSHGCDILYGVCCLV